MSSHSGAAQRLHRILLPGMASLEPCSSSEVWNPPSSVTPRHESAEVVRHRTPSGMPAPATAFAFGRHVGSSCFAGAQLSPRHILACTTLTRAASCYGYDNAISSKSIQRPDWQWNSSPFVPETRLQKVLSWADPELLLRVDIILGAVHAKQRLFAECRLTIKGLRYSTPAARPAYCCVGICECHKAQTSRHPLPIIIGGWWCRAPFCNANFRVRRSSGM